MRRYALILTVLCLAGCTTSSGVKTVSLNDAILRGSQEIGKQLPGKTNGQKPIVAVVNVESGSPELSSYVMDRLMSELVKADQVTVVDREHLELLQKEMNFHLSGEVSDDSARAIGKKLGASSIIIVSIRQMGRYYRFVVKTLSVETAALEVSTEDHIRPKELAVFGEKGQNSPRELKPKPAPKPKKVKSSAFSSRKDSKLLQFSDLPGLIPQEGDAFTIIVERDTVLRQTAFDFGGRRVKFTIRSGSAGTKTLTQEGDGYLFRVEKGATLVLEDITLQGVEEKADNYLIQVAEGGALIMNQGSALFGGTVLVVGNFSMNGGRISKGSGIGVLVAGEGGNFDMTEGIINDLGCGVYIHKGNFTMKGGTISNNSKGGGVWVYYGGSFSMTGGTISGNSSGGAYGGGVTVSYTGTFNMTGGTISGNRAESGGGVYVSGGSFSMSGGTISGNSAGNVGGGVYILGSAYFQYKGKFQKGASGGIIYGSNDTNPALRNAAEKGGHAVWVDWDDSKRKRDSTAGAMITLDNEQPGGWD